eukprot:GHVT01054492.1.p1 GENE.GHVT01054492.1~~GHVT01054492.1.p1  ORF type:complete len:124 (+),score=12.31 GHVT01054492.1:91-462(+)
MAENIPKRDPLSPTDFGVARCIFPQLALDLCQANRRKHGLFTRVAFVAAVSLCFGGNLTLKFFVPVAAYNSAQSSTSPQPPPHTPAFRRLMDRQGSDAKNDESTKRLRGACNRFGRVCRACSG